MLGVLQDLPSMLMSNPQLKAQLSSLAFLPTRQQGQLASPSHLYDPRNQQLLALLDPEKSFPIAPFDTEEVSNSRSHPLSPHAAASVACASR